MRIYTGVLGIIAGLVVLSQPVLSTILTTSFLVWFLGIAAIIYGISGLITGIRLRKETKGEWTMILGGIFSIVFGIILITSLLRPKLFDTEKPKLFDFVKGAV